MRSWFGIVIGKVIVRHPKARENVTTVPYPLATYYSTLCDSENLTGYTKSVVLIFRMFEYIRECCLRPHNGCDWDEVTSLRVE